MSDPGSPRDSPKGEKGTSHLAQLITAPNPVFSSELLNTLKSFWLENKLCDLQLFVRQSLPENSPLTLKSLVGSPGDTPSPHSDSNGIPHLAISKEEEASTQGWDQYNVHRVIIAACSPVVDQILRARKATGASSEKMFLNFQMLDSKSFARLLFYMYSGKLDVSNMNDILSTLVAARALKMSAAMTLCARLLVKFMTNDNVVDLLSLSQAFELEDLTGVAFRCICENFVQIACTPSWLTMDPRSVEHVVTESSLCCNTEADVVIAVARWTMHSFAERVSFLQGWLARPDCIRLAHLPSARLDNLLDLVQVSLGGMPSPPPPAPADPQQRALTPQQQITQAIDAALAAEQRTRATHKRPRTAPSRRYAAMACPPNYCSFTFAGANAHRGYVYDIAESNGFVYSGSRDTDIRVWSLYSKQCVASIPTGNRVWTVLAVGPEDKVSGLRDGIVTGSWDNVIRIWSKYPDFRCLRELRGHRNWVLDLVVINGQLVSSSADNTIKVWDLQSGKVVRTLQGHADHVYGLVAHGSQLVSGSADRTVRLWNAETWLCEGILKGHSGTVRSLLSVDDSQLWSGGADNTICVWDTRSKKLLQTIQGHTDWVESMVQFNDEIVVSASRDETIKFWNVSSRECTQTLKGHRNWVYSLLLTQDKKTLISGSADSSIKIWDYKPM